MRQGQRRLPSALARHWPARGRVRPGSAQALVSGPPRGSGTPRRIRHGDRGSVTAELAVALPALMLLLFVGLTAVSAVTTKLQCVDAAREAARAAARGDRGVEAGERTAPDRAQISVTGAGDTVTATVRAPVRPLGRRLPSLSVQASAVAAVEPGVPRPAR